jgi:hypothetical protein
VRDYVALAADLTLRTEEGAADGEPQSVSSMWGLDAEFQLLERQHETVQDSESRARKKIENILEIIGAPGRFVLLGVFRFLGGLGIPLKGVLKGTLAVKSYTATTSISLQCWCRAIA